MNSIFSTLFTMRFLITTVRLATPIIFAAIGTFIAASSGIGNIAIESIMTFAALAGVLGSYLSGSPWVGVLAGMAIGVVTVMLIAFFSMKLGADAFLIMIALNTFADAVAIFVLYQITGDKGTTASLSTPILDTIEIPIIKDIPIIGEILSGQFVLTYICWILVAVLFVMIYKTPLGMRMRACGLNAEAARTAGINVEKLRVLSLVLSGRFRRHVSVLELSEDLLQRYGLRTGLDGCCGKRYRKWQLLGIGAFSGDLCGLPCRLDHLQLQLRIPD